MYFQLTNALKRRMILELRKYWATHPRFPDLVDNIQGKFSFNERPQHGIIVKTGSANKVTLAWDNYQGVVHSYATLAMVDNYPGTSIEWVREDSYAIKANGGTFPTAAGLYYIELTEDNEFYVDPLLDVRNERVTKVTDLEYQLQHPYLEGSLRLRELPSNLQLYEGVNYSADAATGTITLTKALPNGLSLSADYRYSQPSKGPFPIKPNYADRKAISGLIIAFGRRCQKGDRMVIVVSPYREAVALEYGGRWELSLDFDIIARDVYAQQEISDRTVMWLWGISRSHFVEEGINVTDVSLGGESEEVYDETGDDYYFTSMFSMTMETDWSVHVPLTRTIRQVSLESSVDAKTAAGMTDEELATADLKTRLRVVDEMGLLQKQDPYFANRTAHFEIIK